jgi:hypothetical protein
MAYIPESHMILDTLAFLPGQLLTVEGKIVHEPGDTGCHHPAGEIGEELGQLAGGKRCGHLFVRQSYRHQKTI